MSRSARPTATRPRAARRAARPSIAPSARRRGARHCLPGVRHLLAAALLTAVTLAGAQQYYRLPGASAEVSGGAVVLQTRAGSFTYVQGIGWIEPIAADPPVVVNGDVLGTLDLIRALGIDAPVLSDVRFGGDAAVRIVFEISGLSDAGALQPLAHRGALGDGESLRLRLPEMLVPAEPVDPQRGVDVVVEPAPGGTDVEIRGPASTYEVFALDGPPRVVVDVVPQPAVAQRPVEREVAPGVRYRRFLAPNGMGLSVVHAVEVEPGIGEVRVVGESRVPRRVDELASGAMVAINAGYFDPVTFAAIGLLRVDYALFGLPSRNRAVFAASGREVAIARAGSEVSVRVDGRLAVANAAREQIEIVQGFGGLAGRPDMGMLVVAGDRVVRNTVGPREVPEGAYALVYDPSIRELARVDEGQRVHVDVSMTPAEVAAARYAVEAGPLLVEGGLPAFDPSAEAFQRGLRILDAYTQQAAVGVGGDGTLWFVVAETMRAEDLVGVFMSLGAETAMRLDSGSSAALIVNGEPVNRVQPRRVVSAIVLRFAPAAEAPTAR